MTPRDPTPPREAPPTDESLPPAPEDAVPRVEAPTGNGESASASAVARRAVVASLRASETIALAGHLPLDGDGLGSALALARALRAGGKRAVAVLADAAPRSLTFLPGLDDAVHWPDPLPFEPDVFVALDGSARDRFGALLTDLPERTRVLVVDHHVSNTRFGDVSWVDPGYSATGLMAYDLISDLELPLDRDTAVCLYTALVTDTGRFSYSNTCPRTHRAAADLLARGARPEEVLQHVFRCKSRGQLDLFADTIATLSTAEDGAIAWTEVSLEACERHGVSPRDTGNLIEIATSLAGVEVAILFRERTDETRVSIRTSGTVDAAAIATAMGGGGHPRAAGLPFRGSPREALEAVLPAVIRALRERRTAP